MAFLSVVSRTRFCLINANRSKLSDMSGKILHPDSFLQFSDLLHLAFFFIDSIGQRYDDPVLFPFYRTTQEVDFAAHDRR